MASILISNSQTHIMTQENFNESVDPDDVPEINRNAFQQQDVEEDEELEENEEDDDEGYDILPSNGPGLAGDDGEQVVNEGQIEDEEDKEEEDD
jgi:hypothetical protein